MGTEIIATETGCDGDKCRQRQLWIGTNVCHHAASTSKVIWHRYTEWVYAILETYTIQPNNGSNRTKLWTQKLKTTLSTLHNI